jgi:ubiquinone/menaquinone biosynthesis C-methylase UbiE
MGLLLALTKTLLKLVIGCIVLTALAMAVAFPFHTDLVAPPKIQQKADDFYAKVYAQAAPGQSFNVVKEYVQSAQEGIRHENVVPRVTTFVEQYGLENKHVLDVGAGTGYLQDVVKDYVALDLSSTAKRYFHKPYVEASATDMPFRDNEFDALWSIWVLEHVPTPEQALLEIRRVTKDGGLLYLLPAWNCSPLAAEGYPVRPYSDFGLKGKFIKATVPARIVFDGLSTILLPTHWARETFARWSGHPTRLHYVPLTPNYDHFWMSDADAVNSLDFFETMLWFTSRGDECLNCGGDAGTEGKELIIRVHKARGI